MGISLTAKQAAEQVKEDVRREAERWEQAGITPTMAVLLVEGDPASAYYAETKRRIAFKLGVRFELSVLSQEQAADERRLIETIEAWNADERIHGIMLELPLPAHLSTAAVTLAIDPRKDVDGVAPANKLAVMTGEPGLYPATPQACIRLLQHYGYTLAGKHVVLVGRGQTVGLPLFHMLQREQATVTVCHSRTVDLKRHVQQADIVIAAVGREGLLARDMFRSDCVIIDAGINERADGSIAGDVAPDALEAVAALSPVPGGVGTLTTAMLFANVMAAVRLQQQTRQGGDAR
jgi:methylenetetrahydrofolate dehydrogenase (NADP+)/methenyltetrahydrofolate cyclohydrolase